MSLSLAGATALSAGISAAAGTTQSVINSRGGRRSQKRALAYNKELAEYQNQLAIQNWELQNAYNSPAAQMQRLREAGLNPLLIYGDGAGAAGSAASAPDAAHVAPSVSEIGNYLPQFDNVVRDTLAAAMQGAQIAHNSSMYPWLELSSETSARRAADERRVLFSEFFDNDGNPTTNPLTGEMGNYFSSQMRQQYELLRQQADSQRLQNAIRDNDVKMLPTQNTKLELLVQKLKYDANLSSFYSGLVDAGLDPRNNAMQNLLQTIFLQLFSEEQRRNFDFSNLGKVGGLILANLLGKL